MEILFKIIVLGAIRAFQLTVLAGLLIYQAVIVTIRIIIPAVFNTLHAYLTYHKGYVAYRTRPMSKDIGDIFFDTRPKDNFPITHVHFTKAENLTLLLINDAYNIAAYPTIRDFRKICLGHRTKMVFHYHD